MTTFEPVEEADFDAESEAFFDRHQGGTGNVWIATIYCDGDAKRSAVFSSQKKAAEWLDIQPEYDGAVCVPFIVDEPDYGNVAPH